MVAKAGNLPLLVGSIIAHHPRGHPRRRGRGALVPCYVLGMSAIFQLLSSVPAAWSSCLGTSLSKYPCLCPISSQVTSPFLEALEYIISAFYRVQTEKGANNKVFFCICCILILSALYSRYVSLYLKNIVSVCYRLAIQSRRSTLKSYIM